LARKDVWKLEGGVMMEEGVAFGEDRRKEEIRK